MKMKPSRIILVLLLLLMGTNAAWLYLPQKFLTQPTDSRDAVLVEQQRALSQLKTLAAASLTGRPLVEIEPTLRRLFPASPAAASESPRGFVIGDLLLTTDEKGKITGISTITDQP